MLLSPLVLLRLAHRPPPAADGLPATVLLRQLLPAHEALTHRLEGLLRGMRVRLIIWDFCLYCVGPS